MTKERARAKVWVEREFKISKAKPKERIAIEEKTIALAKEYGLVNSPEDLWPHEELIRRLKEVI